MYSRMSPTVCQTPLPATWQWLKRAKAVGFPAPGCMLMLSSPKTRYYLVTQGLVTIDYVLPFNLFSFLERDVVKNKGSLKGAGNEKIQQLLEEYKKYKFNYAENIMFDPTLDNLGLTYRSI